MLFSADNVLQPGLGVGKLLDWSFSEFDMKSKRKLYAAFWREVIERAEEEELSGNINVRDVIAQDIRSFLFDLPDIRPGTGY
jgi:hypothetical protein